MENIMTTSGDMQVTFHKYMECVSIKYINSLGNFVVIIDIYDVIYIKMMNASDFFTMRKKGNDERCITFVPTHENLIIN